MLTYILAAVVAAMAVAIGLRWRSVATRNGDHGVTPAIPQEYAFRRGLRQLKKVKARVSSLEADHADLRAAVAHGIDDVTRINNRINASLRRYHEERDESGYSSPALDSELERVQPGDGVGGGEVGVPQLPEDVEEAQSSIPGVSARELAMVRGVYGAA